MDNKVKKDSRIFIAGHKGLLGSALVRALKKRGYTNLITYDKNQLDLTSQKDVEAIFLSSSPEYVFLAAAKVGSISANIKSPADFIYDNLQMASNVIEASSFFWVDKLLFYGSNCMYPRECSQPMKEEYLYSGPLEPTNQPYAVAKLAGLELCRSFNSQHGKNFITAVPASMYGPNDCFAPEKSHVLASFLVKFHEAKEKNILDLVLYGDCLIRREFIYVDDAADASLFLMENHNASDIKDSFINVGVGDDICLGDLAQLVAKVVDYRGDIMWNLSGPKGMQRKLLDSGRMNALGWKPKMNLEEGIKKTYEWYLENLA